MAEIMNSMAEDDGVSNYKVSHAKLGDESKESKLSKKAALRELHILQDHTLQDYKIWANQYIKYRSFDGDKDVDVKLKQCNDAYTLSFLCNCVSSFRNGIDISSMATAWFTYKFMQFSNPNMSEDMSRLALNLRDSLVEARDNGQLTGVIGVIGKKFIKHYDDNMLAYSADRMNQNIERNISDHTLDNLSMSPRQLAVLKINFMEQFYVDSRSIGDLSKPKNMEIYRDYRNAYNNAIRHIEAIAKNSGYGMDVIAAEERYFVGLKMATDENYHKVFSETGKPFGVSMSYDNDDDKTWSGRFRTADGHLYTVGGSVHSGAFTPREPLSTDINSTQAKSINAIGQIVASAENFLSDGRCKFSKSDCEFLKGAMKEASSDYESYLDSVLKDDNVSDASVRKQFIKDTFLDGKFTAGNNNTYSDVSRDPVNDFDENMRYVVRKDMYEYYRTVILNLATKGHEVTVTQHTSADTPDFRKALKDAKMQNPLSADQLRESKDIPDDVVKAYITGKFKKDYADDPTSEVNALVNTDDPDAIIDYLIDRRIEKKSPEEKRELLIHTCANMIQGYNAIGKFEAPYDTISKKRKSQLANEASSEDEYSVEDLLEDSNTDTHNPDDHSDDSNNGPDAPGTPSGPDNPGEPDDHGGSDSEDDDEDEPDDEPEPDM